MIHSQLFKLSCSEPCVSDSCLVVLSSKPLQSAYPSGADVVPDLFLASRLSGLVNRHVALLRLILSVG